MLHKSPEQKDDKALKGFLLAHNIKWQGLSSDCGTRWSMGNAALQNVSEKRVSPLCQDQEMSANDAC